jgi:hypothetical protein
MNNILSWGHIPYLCKNTDGSVFSSAHPNTCVLPGMFQGQDSASKPQLFQGLFGDFLGSCNRLQGLKADKSRFRGPCVASVDGPINYQGKLSSTKRKNKFHIVLRDVFNFYGTSWASCVWLGVFAWIYALKM